MTDALDLHGFGLNDRSGKVRWVCHELGIPVNEHRVGFGAHRAPPYTDLNPYGMIPAAQWQGRTMIESTAICTFLAEQHDAGLVVAPDEAARFDYLRWVALFAETLESRLVEYLLGSVEMIPDTFVQTTERRLKRQLPVVLGELPSEGFLVADRFTLADVEAAYSLRLAIRAGLLTLDEVGGYLRPLMARPAAQSAGFFSSIG